ncbi:amino acid permease [Phenylobacterium montanum]|uniref:4-hydroxybenzoate brominase (decarboxylating) n=1 Tax=Phenylobacterium montanum TaxID=2823693 RepID=A0A975G2L0_9CAUL|nr:amino acid permease [Caulobacter sp. S6]QUD89629.1 amino acid permease [Caulobacter sp. S6]
MDETLRDAARSFEQDKKRRRVLSTPRIVFLVVAAAAPLAAMVGNLPLALSRGNGAGMPGAFLLAALTLACFAVGYAQMSRRVVNTGAFYTYVAMGLGKPAGVGAAFIAVVAYVSMTIGMAGAFGYFVSLISQSLGTPVSWIPFAALGALITGVLGYRSIDLSSKVLGALMIAEIGVLAVFDLAVVAHQGLAALPAASFAPQTVFAPGFAVALMFAYTSFIGFESAALYGEEAREPARSIPAATYASVALIGVFYLLTGWITVGAIGVGHAKAFAAGQGGQMLFALIGQYCGKAAADVAGALLCTSLLASYLAIHNAATRYLFALAREKLLPPVLGRFNPVRYAPSNASLAVSGLTVACLAAFALSGADPYRLVFPALIGMATLGVICLQAFAALAIIAYFRRTKGANPWTTLVLPGVGAGGLILAVALVATNFRLLTQLDIAWVDALPALYGVVFALGIGFCLWLKARRPKVYAGLAVSDLRAQGERTAPRPRSYDGRVCIVGAGPAGLVAARAFKLEGVPYDQFERHTDVGGIWDIDNPGSSMYESAHFISSRYTSGFFGLPMPDSYPDYPDHRQILDYVKSFADAFDLRRGVNFGSGVARATPIGDGAEGGWDVTLQSGQARRYQTLVCANGVTWHPNLPAYPGLDRFAGDVRHTVEHRSSEALKGRRVLVVGAGNSGVDIACDAARSANAAFLSVRRGYRFVPKHIFGIPTDVFLSGQVHPPKGVMLPDDPSKMLDVLTGDLTRYGLPAPDHKALESHPIMNSQILHHLAHGDILAKPDIAEFTRTGAVFKDGTEEAFDLVLFATGYEYRIPYLDERLFTWNAGHPELYLNLFHRKLAGLSVLGFVEFASAAYQRFDEMAQMLVMDANIRQTGQGLEAWTRMKAEHRPNLRGAMSYVDSPRHANYVEVATYRRVLGEIRAQFGWFDPGPHTYDGLRVRSSAKAKVEAA